MGKSTKTSSTQTSSPWAPTQGYLKNALSDLEGLFSSGGMTTDYSGDWVADLTDDQKSALSGITDATSSGNSTLSSLISSLTGTATGENTTQNWDTIKNNVIADIMPSINSTFAGSNMTGSTLHQQNLSQGLSNGMATAQNDYNQQQFENQLSAGSSISSLLNQIIGNNQTAYDAATQVQNQEQNELDSLYTNGLLGQNADFEALSNYLSLLTGVGSLGSSGTGTTTKTGSMWDTLSSLIKASSSTAG
ncbi:hypothetical protein D2T29_10760 [Sinirhodobacter populi]|uniref:Uncharacterized protein n=1 Tax=Paenirhodobacter populi TaxID=2306993 RepID=A0A443KFH0_9RHOB|nr:hypothetical protein [Sinirhodobacter populi]RWR31505.1 hypothetical protein D2T29_10760 [Sinirhodobacter populi]